MARESEEEVSVPVSCAEATVSSDGSDDDTTTKSDVVPCKMACEVPLGEDITTVRGYTVGRRLNQSSTRGRFVLIHKLETWNISAAPPSEQPATTLAEGGGFLFYTKDAVAKVLTSPQVSFTPYPTHISELEVADNALVLAKQHAVVDSVTGFRSKHIVITRSYRIDPRLYFTTAQVVERLGDTKFTNDNPIQVDEETIRFIWDHELNSLNERRELYRALRAECNVIDRFCPPDLFAV